MIQIQISIQNLKILIEFEDINEKLKILKEEILNEKLESETVKKKPKKVNKTKKEENENENKTIKVTSVYLFKKIFNQACNKESKNNKDNVSFTNYQIPKDDLTKYNLKKCINDNINDYK